MNRSFLTNDLLSVNFSEAKKTCKKLKASPPPLVLKHYKDGDFHKDYDRQLTVTSIVNFMRDPAGDLPWEEDPLGADVFHVSDPAVSQLFVLSDEPQASNSNLSQSDVSQSSEKRGSSNHGHVLRTVVWLLQANETRLLSRCYRAEAQSHIGRNRCESPRELSHSKIVQHQWLSNTFVLRGRCDEAKLRRW